MNAEKNNLAILIVDDEKEIRDLIEIYLMKEGYSVFKVEDGAKALEFLKQQRVQLILLDVMMPSIDGIETCRRIREFADVPIIMISAKGSSTDKIMGIITGADDYVAKPFDPLEIVVRVNALLKRTYNKSDSLNTDEIVVEDLRIRIKEHKVVLGVQEILLTHKEFEILKLFATNRGIVFSSRHIYETVWNEEFFESDAAIMTHIKNLRFKLGDHDIKNAKYIKTVWGVGYKIDK